MTIYTIGFTKKSAQQFFELLRKSGAQTLVDVRLNNVSQLAGFAKRDDLAYFLGELCEMDYLHLPKLGPTKPMLDDYKNGRISWPEYERQFLDLMNQRQIQSAISRSKVDNAVLLCSEGKPDHCHRRLVAEYLATREGTVEIEHLI